MTYFDLREFLTKLEAEDELARVKAEVNPQYELGAVCRKALDSGGVERNKALFFESPKGYDIPIACNILDSRPRYFMALDIKPEEIVAEYSRRTAKPVPPRLVKDGPCKEKVLIGDEVDLFMFPIPTWNEKDGGPFITTPTVIAKDPDTGRRNVGRYRMQVHDGKSTGIYAASYREIGQWMKKCHDRNEALPVAIAIGTDPIVSLCAVALFPPGVDELAMAGALRGEPVEVVQCETVPLEVPSTAEIVLEGEIRPGDMKVEGPFGEFPGYYGERGERPFIRIKAITHRSSPIFEATYEGRPPTGSSTTQGLFHEIEIMRLIRGQGLKKIRMSVGSAMFMAIASIEKHYAGQERMLALDILSTPSGRFIKTLILVDKDIDPDNWTQVEWALGTRFQPRQDLTIIDDIIGIYLDPSLLPEEKKTWPQGGRTSKVIIDATKPIHRDYPEECLPKKDIMALVEANWSKYGIP
jgi:UbiD family decarboxylase